MKHTPGPWMAKDQVIRGPGLHPYPTVESQIADCRQTWECRLSDNEAEANARLIAAAPELLEALRLVLNDNRLMNAMNREQARAILDAIAKATGGAE